MASALIVPTSKSGQKIWPRTYCILVRAAFEKMIGALLSMTSEMNLTPVQDFLKAYSPRLKIKKLTNQNNNFMICLKNVSSLKTRKHLLKALQTMMNLGHIHLRGGWINWEEEEMKVEQFHLEREGPVAAALAIEALLTGTKRLLLQVGLLLPVEFHQMVCLPLVQVIINLYTKQPLVQTISLFLMATMQINVQYITVCQI